MSMHVDSGSRRHDEDELEPRLAEVEADAPRFPPVDDRLTDPAFPAPPRTNSVELPIVVESFRVDLKAIVHSVLGTSPKARRAHLMEGLCLSVAADGEVHPAELSAMHIIAAAIPGIPADKVRRWMDRLVRRAAEIQVNGDDGEGVQGLGDHMRDEPLRAKEEVFALATLVQYVDGELSESEEDFSNSLAQALGLTLEQAQSVIDSVENAIEKSGGRDAPGIR